jgi:S-formylglutathione hydrolase FrmB
MKKKLLCATVFLLLCAAAHAAEVETVHVASKAMAKKIPVSVVLPRNYATTADRRFPVVYLLHGAGGDYRAWLKEVPEVKDEADRRAIIVICPNAENSWYFDSPRKPASRYETFCAEELVKWADATYHTVAARRGRATCGLSMGGHGAMWLAIRHRDTFSAAVALSGGVDIRPFNGWCLPDLLGDKATHKQEWETHTVVNLIPMLKNGDLALCLDCGTADFFLAVNRDMHQRLLAAKIDHDYCERPGDHSWPYWRKTLPYAMQFIDANFRKLSAGKAEKPQQPATAS